MVGPGPELRETMGQGQCGSAVVTPAQVWGASESQQATERWLRQGVKFRPPRHNACVVVEHCDSLSLLAQSMKLKACIMVGDVPNDPPATDASVVFLMGLRRRQGRGD